MAERAVGEWRYLQPSDLQRMRRMEFVARRIVEGYLSGKHRSPIRDFSQEFTDYRAYAPGDDLRMLDWKAYARSDRYYVKLFRKDTGMSCYLFLDASRSMLYRGEPAGPLSKLEYACYLVAALAFLIVKQGDRTGLCVFDTDIREYLPPAGTMGHLFDLLNRLERTTPRGRTRLANALRKAFPLLPRRGLVIVVSDFLDEPSDLFSALDMFTHRQHEVLLFHVLHPDELRLPDVAHARFRDMEVPGVLDAEPGAIRRAYEEEMKRFLDQMRAQARARRIEYVLASTDTGYYEVLERYLNVRRHMTVG